MLFRLSKVAGICLGFCLACSLLINTDIPTRPLGTNLSQQISFQTIVYEEKVKAGQSQTAKNTSVLEESGVILPENGFKGIGNQLFVYACSYALARDRNLPLLNLVTTGSSSRSFHTRERLFALDKFQVPLTNGIQRSSINTSAITYVSDFQILFRTYPPDRTLLQLGGFCQGYKGFWEQYKEDIIAMFQLRPEVVQGFSQYVTDLVIDIENAEESVAVHVRRGDLGGSIPISYQQDSILKISKMLAQRRKLNDSSSEQRPPTLFIFSDDIEYCRRELNKETEAHDLVFVTSSGTRTGGRTTSLEDFYLMMKCKHFIIPNSTFSWWAAFLATHKKNNGSSSNSDSIVIASKNKPSYWKRLSGKNKENLNFYQNVIEEFAYFPNGWIIHTPSD